MKSKTNFKKGSYKVWSPYFPLIKSIVIIAFIITGFQVSLKAQTDSIIKPSWWFGVAGGANFNFYRGTTQMLNSDLIPPVAFHDGYGVGLFLAPLVEFHRPDSRWGLMLQAGYDGRSGKFKQVKSPCNCPQDLTAGLNYITVEPSLRFAPFKNNFYLYGGPRLAFNLDKSFTYKQGTNPDYSDQIAIPDVKANFSDVEKTIISMQIAAGYDIPISSQKKKTQFVLSPFVSFQPYFGQSPRSVETWNITTLRAGAALKFGVGSTVSEPVVILIPAPVVSEPVINFYVNSPSNIPVDRRVRETFPLRNYVFFDLGSTQISDRYVLLKKDQVKAFKEDQLEEFKPKQLPGRSARQMVVYYNVLNILGDRMQKYPTSTITLVGSSESGPADGRAMAESIKFYLVDVFGIDGARIKIEGRNKPKIPSEQPGGTKELDLLREGDRRVSIESKSPELLMEFQSGPDALLKPVVISAIQEAPIDSYVSFSVNIDEGKDAFVTWSLEVRDEKGTLQNFGPYTQEKVSIPGKSILGDRLSGDFVVTMVGVTKSGKTIRKETPVHMVLWTPTKDEEGMRFSVIYEFNDSKSIAIYKDYLTEIVAPKIPIGGTVIIHGHTDVIGEDDHNLKLSWARANDVRKIIEKALRKEGRNDVKFEVFGFGEDASLTPFENKYPEERFYNRTVVIDIIPKK